jgi:L,D-peptidoglycan transpeptidase YkuD (ErfK/YbiS/YcfS/YnhG family)
MRRAAACALALSLALTACGPSDSARLEPDTQSTATSAAPDRQPVVAEGAERVDAQGPAASIISPPPTVTRTTTSAPRTSEGSSSSTRTADSGGSTCDVGRADGNEQVVVVESSGTRATVRACSRQDDGTYATDLGPFDGWVGRSGVTSASSKREGDGHTPGGVYPLRGGFGAKGDPGLPQGWFTVDGNDFWVDDPGSALYNTHQRGPVDGRWNSAENLLTVPAYNYAQVIGYNEGQTPGEGSAIFLHVSTGGPTAGCVSVSTSALLDIFRWERSGAVIAIS